jgi:Winged helix DNA-binding domain
LIRWDGARQPTVWTVPPLEADPRDARLELARRYLHSYGPTTPEAFGRWAGIGRRHGVAAFEALGTSLTPVQTPVGDAWVLTEDEAAFRAAPGPWHPRGCSPAATPISASTEPIATSRSRTATASRALDPARLGGLLVGGQIAGTWRRAGAVMTVQPWRRLSRAERDAVAAEAGSLPLPGTGGGIVVRWDH